MLKYVRFFKEYVVCSKNKESSSYKHKFVILMIKLFQKRDYYLSLMKVAHCIFVRVEITCGVDEKTLRLIVNFLMSYKTNVIK